MNLIERIAYLRDNPNPNRITVPRGVLFTLLLIAQAFMAVSASLFHGVLIVAAVPVLVYTIYYIYLTYQIWKVYYSLLSYIIIMLAEAAVSVFISFLLRNLVVMIAESLL